MTEQGLDAAFLDFIRDPDPQARSRIHDVYVELLAGCTRVADLGCGEGEFVVMLSDAGHDAIGVDSDPSCLDRARQRGAHVVEADAARWLAAQPDSSLDALFAGHLVEHLPYIEVLALYRQAYRVLRPGGRLLVVTPNVRSLYSHLEMFHLHFGHVAFYHPHLLAFFAQLAGFGEVVEGENPRLARPLFGPPASRATDPAAEPIELEPVRLPPPRDPPELPRRGGILGRAWWRAKTTLVHLLVRPYVDVLAGDLNAAIVAINADRARLADLVGRAIARSEQSSAETRAALEEALRRMDGSFEAYVMAHKTAVGHDAAGANVAAAPGPS